MKIITHRTMKKEYSLRLSDKQDEALRQSLSNQLVYYNSYKAGPGDYRLLSISIEDGNGTCVGGLYGRTYYGWLFIELIFVPHSLRRKGIGTKLVEMAELEAIDRKCHSVWLDTYEFQARSFYEKLDYEVFGELPDFPKGFSRYFMKKSFKH